MSEREGVLHHVAALTGIAEHIRKCRKEGSGLQYPNLQGGTDVIEAAAKYLHALSALEPQGEAQMKAGARPWTNWADHSAQADTAPGREEPKPIPFPVSNAIQAWLDYALAMKTDYESLAAELERVKKKAAFEEHQAAHWRTRFNETEQRATTAEASVAQMREAVIAMAEDGWLLHSVEGLSPAQQKCHDAYMLIQKHASPIARSQDE